MFHGRAKGFSDIELWWMWRHGDNVRFFHVYRSDGKGGALGMAGRPADLVVRAVPGQTEYMHFKIRGLRAATEYQFGVIAEIEQPGTAELRKLPHVMASCTTAPVPTVDNLTARTAGFAEVGLTWEWSN